MTSRTSRSNYRPLSAASKTPNPPSLRWDKIYEARERLAEGDYDNPDELDAVISWLDAVFGESSRSASSS